jgi:RimJ/RimL family protein N-acetyltransferase
MALIDHWPLFGLRVATPRLVLQYPDDEMVGALATLTGKGVHDPATMPFMIPWTDTPAHELPRNSAQHFWRNRAAWTTDEWHCPMAVLVDDEVVGVQVLFAKQFSTLRSFETGSWLGLAHQGKGVGKEMRAAVLHLGFAGLGGQVAITGAWHDNFASLGVTRSVGYEPNGQEILLRRDKPDLMLHFRMERAAWETRRRDDITIEGLEPCLELFGIA